LENPVLAWWQLTQAVPEGTDKVGSLKIFSPKDSKALSGRGSGGRAGGFAASAVTETAQAQKILRFFIILDLPFNRSPKNTKICLNITISPSIEFYQK
jgi:hypothetical protein